MENTQLNPRRIAWLGLGQMGSRMAQRLVRAGHSVVGYSPSESTRKHAHRLGIPTKSSASETVADAELILSAVPDGAALRQAYLARGGVLENAKAYSVCFDFSTVSIESSEEVAAQAQEHGIRFLDTPVSGSTPQAEAGTLAVMAGGDANALDTYRDVLNELSSSVTWFGPNGSGLRMKLTTNLILGIHIVGLAEGLRYGTQLGLSPELMLEFLKTTPLPKLLDYKGPQLVERNYTPGFQLQLLQKDLALIQQAGARSGARLPLTSAAMAQVQKAASLGLGKQDMTSVLEAYASSDAD